MPRKKVESEETKTAIENTTVAEEAPKKKAPAKKAVTKAKTADEKTAEPKAAEKKPLRSITSGAQRFLPRQMKNPARAESS